jgi:hypothetical protein
MATVYSVSVYISHKVKVRVRVRIKVRVGVEFGYGLVLFICFIPYMCRHVNCMLRCHANRGYAHE